MSSPIRRYLPHLLVGITISLIMVGAYAAVGFTSASSPRAIWKTNPLTISFTDSPGTGTAQDSLTCRPTLTGLTLTASSGTSKIRLTVSPSTVVSCGSSPTHVALTATCLVAPRLCIGTYHGQVKVTQPATYRNFDTLRVTIHVTSCPHEDGECEHQ